METTAGQPVYSAPVSGVLRAGGHVYQLLNLAHALAGNPTDGAGSDSVASGPVGMEVGSLTDAQCVGWAQDVEALLRVGQALAVQVAGELGQRVAAGRFAETGSRGQVGLLVDALQLSAAEASRRLKLAAVVLPVVEGISGAVAPVAHPVLGEVFLSGAVSQERASMVARYVADADRLAAEGRITEETRVLVEESLVGTARVQGPDFVRTVGNQILSHLDPDGHKPSHAELLAKQGLFFHRPRNGLISFHGAVTILQHEELMAALDHFGNPNKHKNVDTITGDKDNPDRSGATPVDHPGATAPGSASSVGDGGGCEGQSSLLDGLGGLAGLFTSTGDGAMAQPGPEPAPGQDTGRPGWAEPPERVGSAASEESAEPPTAPEEPDPPEPPDDPDMPESSVPPERPMPPVAAEPSGARNDPDGPEQPQPPQQPDRPDQPEPPQQPDRPEPRVPAGGTPAGVAAGVKGGVGWWGRRLEPWEIPARPPEAPEYATPPVYAGQDWFWLPAEPATGGWAPPSNNNGNNGDFFNIFEDPPAQRPASYRDDTFNIWQDRTAPTALTTADTPPTAAADDATGIAARARAGAGAAEDTSGQWGAGWVTGNDDSDARDIADASDARVEQALSSLNTMDPASTDPAVKDTRTRAQQLLDGLVSCVKLASRTGKLPRNGGLPAQLILSCSQTQLEQAYTGTGAGTVNTTFNGPMPLRLFDAALCDPQITRIVYGTGQEILNAGRTKRLFLPAQRRILYARDLGCSFPECTIPATWTEAHHIIPWQEGGETSIENGCLLCDHHHSLIHTSDWTVQLINGTPWFTPPWLIDRTQTPRRNSYHHGLTPHQRP